MVAREQFPDELIQLVAQATEQHHIEYGVTDASGNNPCVCGQWWDSSDMEGWDEHMAKVALAALDEAGRLLPPVESASEEWAVRWRRTSGGIVMDQSFLRSQAEAVKCGIDCLPAYAAYGAQRFTVHRREHKSFTDGSALVGPWVEVGTEEQPDE